MHPLIDNLCNGGDFYITCFDFGSYCEAQAKVDHCYRDYKKWTTMAILGLAKSGKFSSDRTIAEYCTQIWNVEPVPIPHPTMQPQKRVKSIANVKQKN